MNENRIQANIFQVDNSLAIYKSSRLQVFYKIGVSENFGAPFLI